MTIFVWRVSESPIEGRMMDTQLFRFSDRRSGHRSLPGSYNAHWTDWIIEDGAGIRRIMKNQNRLVF